MKRFLSIVLLMSFVSFGWTQIDELKDQLKGASDTEKPGILNSLAEAYGAKRKEKKGLEYAKDALKEAKAQSNKQEQLRALVNCGNLNSRMNKAEAAWTYFLEGGALAEKLNQKGPASYCYESAGQESIDLKDYSGALELLNKALSIQDDYKSADYGRVYSKIGYAYYSQRSTKKALEAYQKSADYYGKAGDKGRQANSQYTAGTLASNFGDYDQAKSLLTDAKKGAESAGDKRLLKQVEDALAKIDENIERNESGITEFERERAAETENFIDDLTSLNAKTMAEIEGLSLENQVMELKIVAQKEEFEKKALRDSLENERLAQEAQLKDAQLNQEKAEKELANAEAAKATAWLIGAGGIVLLLLLLAGFIVRNNRKLKEKNILIANQNTELDKKNKSITESISYASKIQRALMISNTGLAHTFSDHLLFNKPRDIVSGDFSWCDVGTDDCVLVVADCTGHGVPGALMSVLAISHLEKIVKQEGKRQPKDILARLNNDFYDLLGKDTAEVKDGMDVVIVNVNKTTRKVNFAGSRNPMIYISGGEIQEIKGTKKHLGAAKGLDEFNSTSLDGKPGDTFYLFSDGFYDQKGGTEGKKFYPKRFREMLLEHHSKKMEEQHTAFEKQLASWSEGREQIDDILIVGVRL